ncbi:MAG: M64 family metallopeptidase [Isosphaeraceae bacterium]
MPRGLPALCLVLMLNAEAALAAEPPGVALFRQRFEDATLRVDYVRVGDAKEESASVDALYKQGAWAGSRVHTVDPFPVGRSVVELRDPRSGELWFSRRFDSYFGEYRTTGPAENGVKRAYHESALVPFPKRPARLLLKSRGKDGADRTVMESTIDPEDVTIRREALAPGVTVFPLHNGGDPHACVDVAILAEGYTEAERDKLKRDLDRYAKLLLGHEPFAAEKHRFNLYGVWKPSAESGCDEPSRGVWKVTSLGVSFDALGSERYLLTEDNRALRDVAAHAPYDALYVMVNHPRYGGGGIYNLFCTFTSDNQWSPYIFLHEFGHTFAALADEYYTSSVAYNEFYPKGVEPPEFNITALLDPSRPKWADLVTPGTAVPTPWEKAGYDESDIAYQKIREETNAAIAKAMRGGAPKADVEALKEKSERLSLEHAKESDAYLARSKFVGQVGAFEGAGYASKGLYRPALDCIMFSKGTKPFCPVCARALRQVIGRHGEG